MKRIKYQETGQDLLARIGIHEKYGSRNIDDWMLDLLRPGPGNRILDVACGAGKQCFAYDRYTRGEAQIVGCDFSTELLDRARSENARLGSAIQFRQMNFNRKFPIPEGEFDLLSCCFALYYAEDISFTVSEMHRVIKPGGRLFTTGPMPANKQLFYEIIREATSRPIPPMPGSSRYSSEILDAIRSMFRSVDVRIFENPLTFGDLEPFMAYTRASLSEDRKLWGSFFRGKDDFERTLGKIGATAQARLEREGVLVMTKVVGGFLAHK